MDKLLLTPPVAFIIAFAASALLLFALSKLAIKVKNRPNGATKSYACGEDMPNHMIQPNYGQFFPFAFFFTILHVVALMVTTVPTQTMVSFAIAIVYVLGAVVGLATLYRR